MEENAVSTSAPEAQATTYEPSADASTSVETESASVENAESTGSSEPQTVAEAGGMKVVVDPVTGKRTIEYGEEPQEQEQQEEEASQPETDEPNEYGTERVTEGQEAVRDVEQYNLDEFSAALANGRVDPSRVPQEYQAQYADYRIREALNQRQQQQRQAYEQEMYRRQQIAEQMSPENRIQANKDFYRGLEEEAQRAALKDLGLTQEQLDDAEFADNGEEVKRDYESALSWHKQRLRGEMQARYQQEQAYKAQQQGVYNDIQSFVAEQRAKEPNFDAIDKSLATRYKTLPYEEARQIEQALQALQAGTINQRGVEVIQKYYNDSRKEYYAKKNGLNANKPKAAPKKPPVVETAGTGQPVNKQYKPNYGNLRKANVNQRSAWFDEYFKNNGW